MHEMNSQRRQEAALCACDSQVHRVTVALAAYFISQYGKILHTLLYARCLIGECRKGMSINALKILLFIPAFCHCSCVDPIVLNHRRDWRRKALRHIRRGRQRAELPG
jgi:hypothetical protein